MTSDVIKIEELPDAGDPSAAIGGRLAAHRGRRGVKVSALARQIGVSPSLISQIERGQSRPSVSTLFALAERLNASTWTDADQITAGLQQAAEALERFSHVFARRRRRGRRRGAPPAAPSEGMPPPPSSDTP